MIFIVFSAESELPFDPFVVRDDPMVVIPLCRVSHRHERTLESVVHRIPQLTRTELECLGRQAQFPDHIRVRNERVVGAECHRQSLLDHPSCRMSSQIADQMGHRLQIRAKAYLDARSHGLLGGGRQTSYEYCTRPRMKTS